MKDRNLSFHPDANKMSIRELNSRKLSHHLLYLAEIDKWKTTLYILLHYPLSKINLNTRTVEGGDYLIHLAAFASCEHNYSQHPKDISLERRKYALGSLVCILQRDFTAVNKIAGDGGTVLHCAFAAASSSFDHYEKENEDEYSDNDNDDSDGETYSTDDDETNNNEIDQDFINELTSEAEDVITLETSPCLAYASLSSDELIYTTIKLLLENGADPNTPLVNVHDLKLDDNDDAEIELAYSKEAVVEQWTCLSFSIQWLILAAVASYDQSGKIMIEKSILFLPLPVLVITLLLQCGADPTYMTGVTKGWNALHFIISSAHLLHKIHLIDEIVLRMNTINENSSNIIFHKKKEIPILFDIQSAKRGVRSTVYRFVSNIFVKGNEHGHCSLSVLESFAVAILSNNAREAESILNEEIHSQTIIDYNNTEHAKQSVINNWRSINMYDFPLSHVLWGIKTNSNKSLTLLGMACCCGALDSIRLLVGDNCMLLSECEIVRAIQFLFECTMSNPYSDGASLDNSYDIKEENFREKNEVLSMLLNIDREFTDLQFDIRRQMCLDRALIQACMGIQSVPYSTFLLIKYGADPNIKSIAKNVCGGLKPLHLVAGNCRGQNGVMKANYLLGTTLNGCSSDETLSISLSRVKLTLTSKTADTSENALQISLRKRNFQVAMLLWEVQLKYICDDDSFQLLSWEVKYATLLAEAALECMSIDLFRYAVDAITSSTSEGKPTKRSVIEKVLAKLLLWAIDERSGFGVYFTSLDQAANEKGCHILLAILNIISKQQNHLKLSRLSSWARDKVSGHTPLHMLLRNDRGILLRSCLLKPLCEIMTNLECQTNSTIDLISIPCGKNFGSYTALHLAYSLDCEESIKCLIKFGADQTVLDGDNKKPIDLLPNTSETEG